MFWAHASNTARLEQSFREIADQVKARGRQDPQADVFKLVHDWLRNEKNGRWLLVLDNADHADVLSSAGGGVLQQHLSRYLPPSRHGAVLVTSRTKRAAMQVVDDSDILFIEPMDDTAAQALLREKLGDVDEEDNSIATLAATLDRMPLALVQAAAYIRERAPRCSVRQYLEEYQQSDGRKANLLNREAGHLRRDVAASNSVLITWQISFDHIQKTRPSAAGLLSLMSFFDRQGIQETLLHRQNSTTDDEFEEDMLALRDYSFVKVTRDASTFEMHSLVQLATRTWLENEGQLDEWREQFISNLCAELPDGGYEIREKWQALFPHAQAALAQRPKGRESLMEWTRLLYGMALHAFVQGRAGEAEQMAVISMEVRSEALGDEDVETLKSMEMVGLVKHLGGKYKGAEAIHRQTLARREKVLGHDHPDTLQTMDHLAFVLNLQGKYDEAEVIIRQTLARSEEVLGPEHLETLIYRNSLGAVLCAQGKHKEAEAIHRQTLAWLEKVVGPEHPYTLAAMNSLAAALGKQDKYEESEAIYRQALARIEKIRGSEHQCSDPRIVFGTLASVNGLAHLLWTRHRYNESLTLFKRACAGFETLVGKDHYFTRSCHDWTFLLETHYQCVLLPATTASSGGTRRSKRVKRDNTTARASEDRH